MAYEACGPCVMDQCPSLMVDSYLLPALAEDSADDCNVTWLLLLLLLSWMMV